MITINEVTEINVAKKYGLYWSKSICVDDPKINGLYVYQPTSLPFEPFYEISQKLEQLNNHIFLQLCATTNRFEYAQDATSDSNYTQIEWSLYKEVADQNLESWDYNLKVLSLVNPIILISTFLEWALKRLLLVCCDVHKFKAPKGKSNIDAMLEEIINKLGLQVEIPQSFQEKLDSYRFIRNKFAHGEWDQIGTLQDQDVKEYLVHIEKLFKVLEAQIIHKKYTY
ncbi:TPA: hypothetical protein NKA96_004452 [Vibrio parahaemolyticus]|uniref:hypothetical protein n=1 Tax=Vibrio parahaemolyticus TaxID=670 RepID=UPI001869B91C|nr:hypothetical protein [Vibrio parahaemolyticus]EKB1967641.1 hypothetical protein [Vibrio parahaemolyticus]ELA8093916.1 hypothetical protein [Vibrio parahaemolyticus]MBE4112030.1 hypothetical protein [Vibrio parahaemolyticus]MBE4408339.1 hypothetical protein [Vibrio parahaemolyticus]MCG7792501.1 hypothetical protein [Vibrio parahaemolyticus]